MLATALSASLVLVTASAASAAHSCTSSQYPASPGSASALKVACLLDHSATASANISAVTIHDSTNASWHRGAARSVAVATAAPAGKAVGVTSGMAAITFASGVLNADNVNSTISGTGIPAGARILTVGATTGTMSVNASATSPAGTLKMVGSRTVTYVSGVLTSDDIGRPISGTGIPGAAFITSAGATSGTMSQAATAASLATVAKLVEHTTSRILNDATVTTGAASNLTSNTAKFTAADVGKSVSGAAWSAGAKITAFVSATAVTVAPVATAASTLDTVTIGGVTYVGATPTYSGIYNRQLKNNATAGATCNSSVTLTKTGTSPSFLAADKGLKVRFLNAAGADVAGTWKINAVPTAATATLSAACPATAAWAFVVIGAPGSNAPKDNDPVMSMGVTMNLNPALNVTNDDCNKNTYDGFTLMAGWRNPGSFAIGGFSAPPNNAIAELAFVTSVITFSGFIVPVASDTQVATPHYDFVYPSLPTSLSVCSIGAGTTTNKVALAFGFAGGAPTLMNGLASASLPTGSGNPNSPAIRTLGPQTGPFAPKISLTNGVPTTTNLAGTTCTVAVATTAPTFACGNG